MLFHRVYSVIAPGDTIHVIGKFDDQGKCDVNRDQNYIIVHPDVLVSGTRVLFLLIHNYSDFMSMFHSWPQGM